MLFLSLFWLTIGLLIGALGWLAQCVPSSWQRLAWIWLPVLGAVVACGAGWLGVLLLGNLLSTALTLWVTVLSILALPRVVDGIRGLYTRFSIKKI
jgi:hypothetical protein